MDESFEDDLNAWLNNVADRYVVRETLKRSAGEVTEVVYRRDEQGQPSLGPFIRKRFSKETARGSAYQQILRAQTQGLYLEHQPFMYECETSSDGFQVVMEYVPGQTLSEVVAMRGPGLALARDVFPRLCDAVSELHTAFEQPLIHRDVKPSNVILNTSRLVLIDLGIARVYRTGANRDTIRYGTPGYAPPEQFGYGQTSTLSDVYALGMTLAFCLTGNEPSAELRERQFADPRIPPRMQEVLIKATQFDPERRHTSAQDLRDDFVRAANGMQPSPAEPEGFWKRAAAGKELVAVGRVWNGLLCAFWSFMAFVCVAGTIFPQGSSALMSLPVRGLVFLLVIVIPCTTLCYALLDKRRLRQHKPFSGWKWPIELAVCLVVGLLCIVAGTMIFTTVVPRG